MFWMNLGTASKRLSGFDYTRSELFLKTRIAKSVSVSSVCAALENK